MQIMKSSNSGSFSLTTKIAISIILVGLFGVLGYMIFSLSTANTQLTATLASETALKNQFIENNKNALSKLDDASTTIAALSSKLSLTAEDLADLEDDYRTEKNKNEVFEDQIKDITGTVSDLDKLSKTDKELLQKYSKVYFLNEHYIPEKIVTIPKQYLYNEAVPKKIHGKVEPFLSDMINDALDDGIKIWVSSAYRSFGEQASLKGSYTQMYGTGANAFSADQGYSEHQLGTTLDLTTEGINGGLDGFQNTPAYSWLQKNAHKYGFTLSYPEGNTFYVYEPWHWRFVGVDLAEDLHDDGAHFYDWDQRKIDTYLIKIFD